ncbi:Transmembrane protein 65 like protein [Argiope bruennichi]|uniref:Transmembrane protein 65 like protein n=1 Tax=Argiope bruennichi TaxID=94029 RepID=A0A8T0E5Z7_ARGBR|nr:Transmembrane protein 65 like protein [Argiope bruennichi]
MSTPSGFSLRNETREFVHMLAAISRLRNALPEAITNEQSEAILFKANNGGLNDESSYADSQHVVFKVVVSILNSSSEILELERLEILNNKERTILFEELQRFQTQAAAIKVDAPPEPPTKAQLQALLAHSAVPFIGFGFLDNLIMIIAGDYIDATIGITLGISTMAAAGLGNTLSDVAGIGSAWYVERIAFRIGVKSPTLTPAQTAFPIFLWFYLILLPRLMLGNHLTLSLWESFFNLMHTVNPSSKCKKPSDISEILNLLET